MLPEGFGQDPHVHVEKAAATHWVNGFIPAMSTIWWTRISRVHSNCFKRALHNYQLAGGKCVEGATEGDEKNMTEETDSAASSSET